ncbi:MAG: ATP synthase subunit I [Deltaproteobacteria bacterium]|nr:ATP synthase subunit I [Deltaproteobacteria bacterium]
MLNEAAPQGLFEADAARAAARAGYAGIAAGTAALAAGLLTNSSLATGIAAGFLLGAVNMSWLLRIAGKGMRMPAERAARAVARSYYLRFGATVFLFALVISKGWLSPWQLLAGFSLSIFGVIGVLIFAALRMMRAEEADGFNNTRE